MLEKVTFFEFTFFWKKLRIENRMFNFIKIPTWWSALANLKKEILFKSAKANHRAKILIHDTRR